MLSREDILNNINIKLNQQTTMYLTSILNFIDGAINDTCESNNDKMLQVLMNRMLTIRNFISKEIYTTEAQIKTINTLISMIDEKGKNSDNKKKEEALLEKNINQEKELEKDQ